MPTFGYGCAVFMQSDIVDFQRQGWKPEEIMAGLAAVLPKNIWLYVSQIPNLAALGTQLRAAGRHAAQPGRGQGAGRFHRVALQGQGRAARSHRPRALRRVGRDRRRASRPCASGTTAAQTDVHRPGRGPRHHLPRRTRNEDTRCYFCKNKCLRTFIDVNGRTGSDADDSSRPSKIEDPARAGVTAPDHRQPCEKGTVEDVDDDAQVIKKGLDAVKTRRTRTSSSSPAKAVWRSPNAAAASPTRRAKTRAHRGAARRATR